jgi:hypothetical protein
VLGVSEDGNELLDSINAAKPESVGNMLLWNVHNNLRY